MTETLRNVLLECARLVTAETRIVTASRIPEDLFPYFVRHMMAEFYSSNLYLAAAGWANYANFCGAEKWLRKQAKEEYCHFMKFFDFAIDRLELPNLDKVDRPPTTYNSLLDCFENILNHEKEVTASIEKLAALAHKLGDQQTREFLDCFLAEQVEEVATADLIVGRLKIAADNPAALLLIDRELGHND